MLPFDSTGQVLETNDIFQDGHLLQLKTHCFSRVNFLMWQWHFPKKASTFPKKNTWSKRSVHTWIHLLLDFAFHADHSTMYNPAAEPVEIAPLSSRGGLPLTSAVMISHRTLLPLDSRFNYSTLTNWLSGFLQCWFPSSLALRVSPDLLQGPIWKLNVSYASLLPFVSHDHRCSSLFQAKLCTHHPCLHLNTLVFSPLLSEVSNIFCPFPDFLHDQIFHI